MIGCVETIPRGRDNRSGVVFGKGSITDRKGSGEHARLTTALFALPFRGMPEAGHFLFCPFRPDKKRDRRPEVVHDEEICDPTHGKQE